MILNEKICSLNNSHTRERKKNTKTREWLYRVKVQMLKSRALIEEIQKMYSPYQHFLVVKYFWFIPWDTFWVKDKKVKQLRVNARVGDTSNFAKIPDDLIFNVLLDIDDSEICAETVYKLPYKGKQHHIKLVIDVIELEHLATKSRQELPEFLK